MKKPLLSLVVSGIGLPCIHDCLLSLERSRPDEVLLALDGVGRKLAGLRPEPVRFCYDLRGRYEWLSGSAVNGNYDRWAITNQTLNIGTQAASGKYVAITHEDVTYPENFPWGVIQNTLVRILETARDEVVGVAWPCWMQCEEGEEMQFSTEYGLTTECLIQGAPPVSCAVSKAFWKEIGGYPEENGIWNDAFLQAELRRRKRWLWWLPLVPVIHKSTQSLRAHNWAGGWEKSPIWANFDRNFEKAYGYPFRRNDFAVRGIDDK